MAAVKFEVGHFYLLNSGKHECIRIRPSGIFCGEEVVAAAAWLMNVNTEEIRKMDDPSFDAVKWKDPPKKSMRAPCLVRDSSRRENDVFLSDSFFTSEKEAKDVYGHSFIQWPAYEANWPMIEEVKE